MKIIAIILIIVIILLIHNPLENYTNNFIEYKTPSYKNINELDNFNFIYCKFDGIYNIFSGDVFYRNKTKNSIKNVFNLDTIKSGFYNYTYNYIVLLNNNNLYKYNLFNDKIDEPIFFKDYFKDISKYNITAIDCLFYLENIVYIFSNKSVLLYDLTQDKTVKVFDASKLFNKIPNNIDCCFLNYNNIIKYESLPYIYIIKNKTYYKYKINNKKFTYINSDNFNYNSKNKIVRNNNKFDCDKDGLYRIILVGGGIDNGGYGGVVFNDYKLRKNDSLNFIIGGAGDRIPVKENLLSNSRLPLTGSCSGSGGTALLKNNKILMVAGGGGGWTSEIIKAPSICNSVKYNDKTLYKSNIFFPIKKIVIESSKGNNNEKFKINLESIIINDDNNENVIMDIYENPSYDDLNLKNSSYMYETTYGTYASIEINFSNTLTDYSIDLNYIVETTNPNGHVNSNVIFYDERYRKYIINNFNTNFKEKITNTTILNYLSKNNIPKKQDILDINKDAKHLYLEGGKSGKFSGNDSISNKYNDLNCCGGGGGYKKGQNICLDNNYNYSNISFPTEYIGACGGTSYIKDLSIKQTSHFINNYNNNIGYAIIIRH